MSSGHRDPGFGIPYLAGIVRELEGLGMRRSAAIDFVALDCELRSEAIQALRRYLESAE